MKESSRFRIGRSRPVLGCGLFARVGIASGDFVLEYTGKKIPTPLADTLDTKYLFEIDAEWTIDGSPRSNLARYINHACQPNTEADIVDGKIIITAVRDIAVGEELTIDYGEEYFDEFIKPYGCRCDSCRKVVPV